MNNGVEQGIDLPVDLPVNETEQDANNDSVAVEEAAIGHLPVDEIDDDETEQGPRPKRTKKPVERFNIQNIKCFVCLKLFNVNNFTTNIGGPQACSKKCLQIF